jgi:hypothetical protein
MGQVEDGAAAVEPNELATQIGRSLSAIWERRDGVRPATIVASFDSDVVRCTIEPGSAIVVEPAEDGAGGEVAAVEVGTTDSTAYRHEAADMVARLTKRRVTALIAKRDKKTGFSTNTFTLERRGVKN